MNFSQLFDSLHRERIAENISVEEIIQTFNIHARKAEFKLTDM
jgi:hypothetical protein